MLWTTPGLTLLQRLMLICLLSPFPVKLTRVLWLQPTVMATFSPGQLLILALMISVLVALVLLASQLEALYKIQLMAMILTMNTLMRSLLLMKLKTPLLMLKFYLTTKVLASPTDSGILLLTT